MINDERALRIIQLLAKKNETYTTALEISNSINVSVRTVKKEIKLLKDIVSEYGAVLSSKNRFGYVLEVVDENLFKPFKWQMHLYLNQVDFKYENQNRAYEIARILISQNDYISIDEIADSMHLSKSSIKTVLNTAREIISKFKLNIISLPGKGIKVYGLEMNIRFCMLELFINHNVTAISISNYERYCDSFVFSNINPVEVRHMLIETLNDHDLRILDNNIHRLARYVFIIFNRFKIGKKIEINEIAVKELRGMAEYAFSLDFLNRLKTKFPEIEFEENDVYVFELLILMWVDLSDDINFLERYPLYFSSCHKIVDKVIKRIKQEWHVDLNEIEKSNNLLLSGLIPSFTKIHFNFIGYGLMTGSIVKKNYISSSPLSIALGRTVIEVIKDNYDKELGEYSLLDFGLRIYACIDKIKYYFKARRILLCSNVGALSCEIIKEKLIKRFGKESFEYIDYCAYYEVRNLDQSKYDYLILNNSIVNYPYSLSYMCVDLIPSENQLNEIYKEVILEGYQLKKIMEIFNFNKDFLFENFAYINRENFIRIISYRYAKSKEDIDTLYKSLSEFSDICVWNGVATLIVNDHSIKSNVFNIYSLDKQGMWFNKRVETIVFISVDFDYRLQSLGFIENLCFELVNNSNSIKKVIKSHSLNELSEVVKGSIG